MNTRNINNAIKRVGTFLRRLFCVPKCASCAERLPVFADPDSRNRGIPCFCKSCLSSWCREKAEMCHNCGKTAAKCTCIPHGCKLMQATVPSLFFYHPSSESAASKAIFTLKHKKHTDLYMFLAAELSDEIAMSLGEMGISPSSCVFTYIPRSRQSIRKNGFDQSLRLSHMICKSLGGAGSRALISRDGGKEQKRLSPNERKKNANRAFFILPSVREARSGDEEHSIRGKNIVLIDDVMTSGASAARCVKLLRDAGAENVIFASVARCEKKSSKSRKNKHNV